MKRGLLKKRGSVELWTVVIAFAIIAIMAIIMFIFKGDIEGLLNVQIEKLDYIVRTDITLVFLLMVFIIIIMSILIFNIREVSNSNENRLYELEEEFEKYKLETELKLYLLDNRYLLMDAATRSELTESELMKILDEYYLDPWVPKYSEGEYEFLKKWEFISSKIDLFGYTVDEGQGTINTSDMPENEFEEKYTKKIWLLNRTEIMK